jgi:hypothetical protein
MQKLSKTMSALLTAAMLAQNPTLAGYHPPALLNAVGRRKVEEASPEQMIAWGNGGRRFGVRLGGSVVVRLVTGPRRVARKLAKSMQRSGYVQGTGPSLKAAWFGVDPGESRARRQRVSQAVRLATPTAKPMSHRQKRRTRVARVQAHQARLAA